MATFNLPLTTLADGQTLTQTVANPGINTIQITVNRNVGANPLNGAGVGVDALIMVECSFDGGTTFPSMPVSAKCPSKNPDGSTLMNPPAPKGDGLPATVSSIGPTTIPAGVTHIRGTIKAEGATLSLSGSLVTT